MAVNLGGEVVLAHQVGDGGLNLGLVVLAVDTLARDNAQLLESITLAGRDRLVDLLDRLLYVQAVQVDGSRRLARIVLCITSANACSSMARTTWGLGTWPLAPPD